MVEFRKLENLKNGKPGQKPPEVSFSQLATDLSDQEQVDDNRKILYQKASGYFSQVFASVKNKQGFALEPKWSIFNPYVTSCWLWPSI
jgi:hypothetical protein